MGIANNTVKCHQLQSMEMQFFWVGDKVAQEMYDITWHPGYENLADYQASITWVCTTLQLDHTTV
jgi:hypothetical protein